MPSSESSIIALGVMFLIALAVGGCILLFGVKHQSVTFTPAAHTTRCALGIANCATTPQGRKLTLGNTSDATTVELARAQNEPVTCTRRTLPVWRSAWTCAFPEER